MQEQLLLFKAQRILFIGGFPLPENNQYLEEFIQIEDPLPYINLMYSILLMRSFNDSITDVDLKTLLESADVVLTTANSSSAAESVSLGIPTILMVDPESLNYSPFRKTELAQFVTSAEELSLALIGFNDLVSSQIPDFFCLDDDYPRWRNLLSID